jgi:glycine cleavage system transcriptional repressor
VDQLIVNAIGPDRPGIVGQFTGHLHDAGANVLDSRMVNLRGQFAIILLIEADAAKLAEIRKSLPAVAENLGLRLTLTDGRSPGAAAPVKGIPFKLKTYSLDQPGIVHRVSDVLRQYGVNIEELSARQESAPFDGTPLFLMEMRMTVPQGVSIQTVKSKLQSLCDSLNCDIDIEPA